MQRKVFCLQDVTSQVEYYTQVDIAMIRRYNLHCIKTISLFFHYHVYQFGTGGCTQEAEPVRGAYP